LPQALRVDCGELGRLRSRIAVAGVLPERDRVERAVQVLHRAFELSGLGSLGQEEPFKAQETRYQAGGRSRAPAGAAPSEPLPRAR
jgi:hypothetical protein